MLRLLLLVAAVLLLTILTEVGGIVLLVAIGFGRHLRWRRLATTGLFLVAYAATSLVIVPPLAAMAGRVPLPCTGEPLRALPILCALNRHYVEPKLLTLANSLAADTAATYPGTITVALDANFPFLGGVPLLPHLSHDDGRKLDLSYFYADAAGTYQPAVTRSPIGYWAFEQPATGEETPCPAEWLTTRWDMTWLQPLWPALKLEPNRTRFALNWLFDHGPSHGLQRVFLEPYLAKRLGVASPLLGFQGCRAARHDDHIHLQIS
jgi:hypothetical protein